MDPTALARQDPASTSKQTDVGVFEPQVRGPSDPAPGRAALAQGSATPTADLSDLRQEHSDASFVF
jgi:hypothetical protein